MSQQNVEIVKRRIDAHNRRDVDMISARACSCSVESRRVERAAACAPVGVVYELRGGKISRARAYLDHGEALRAAGLSE